MNVEEAIAIVRQLQFTVAGEIEGLIKGQKAANQRLDKAAEAVLSELIGRKPTKEELKQSTNW